MAMWRRFGARETTNATWLVSFRFTLVSWNKCETRERSKRSTREPGLRASERTRRGRISVRRRLRATATRFSKFRAGPDGCRSPCSRGRPSSQAESRRLVRRRIPEAVLLRKGQLVTGSEDPSLRDEQYQPEKISDAG